ncbi:methyltransferase family protein [Agromyces mariniharenae]|nr:isoprenylcysteine carboxylmethyltransferase family protein [Agromyces mariniharenae]
MTRIRAVYDNTPFPEGQAVGLVVDPVLDRVRPMPLPGSRALHLTAGLLALAAGFALDAWALMERRRRTAGEFRLEEPESLVTTGPYAWCRHPMYVGSWLIHLGVGVIRGSGWVAVTLPVGAIAEHLGALAEERALHRAFGEEWADYRERVPRYAGWPRRRGRATA